jgi:hypothetical protein
MRLKLVLEQLLAEDLIGGAEVIVRLLSQVLGSWYLQEPSFSGALFIPGLWSWSDGKQILKL